VKVKSFCVNKPVMRECSWCKICNCKESECKWNTWPRCNRETKPFNYFSKEVTTWYKIKKTT